MLPRSAESVRRAAALRVFLADHDDLRAAQLCMLAVPDAAVVPAMELVEEDLGPTTALVHCSGALPLSVFAGLKDKRPVGSFHPLAAISDPHDTAGRAHGGPRRPPTAGCTRTSSAWPPPSA